MIILGSLEVNPKSLWLNSGCVNDLLFFLYGFQSLVQMPTGFQKVVVANRWHAALWRQRSFIVYACDDVPRVDRTASEAGDWHSTDCCYF